MQRPALEVADIFRDFGPAWREANRGHVSHAQLKVMSAIEACRTAALGGYVARCENAECGHTVISYCSCRNRHCPKCQGSQALAWMAERKAELLQVPYFHIVFTLPAEIGAIAYQNKTVIYDLLFNASPYRQNPLDQSAVGWLLKGYETEEGANGSKPQIAGPDADTTLGLEIGQERADEGRFQIFEFKGRWSLAKPPLRKREQ